MKKTTFESIRAILENELAQLGTLIISLYSRVPNNRTATINVFRFLHLDALLIRPGAINVLRILQPGAIIKTIQIIASGCTLFFSLAALLELHVLL